MPAFAKTGARLKSIASATGVSGVHVGKKNGVESATTDSNSLLSDSDINALVVTTRHNSHAGWVSKCLEAGKHCFVEKPLALTRQELQGLSAKYTRLDSKPVLMVGFNRRYSSLVQLLKVAMDKRSQPKALTMTVNAGEIPVDHWTQDPEIGGGRIIGEGCHFVDLLRYLVGQDISSFNAQAMDSESKDSVMIQLRFADGSIGAINYLANGHKGIAKERLEVFCGGSIAQLDNFRILKSIGWKGLDSKRLWRQDKGQAACSQAFVDAIAKGRRKHLIPFAELEEVAETCFDIVEQLF